MTRSEVADLVQEELTRALSKHAGLLESNSPLAKKIRLQESGGASTSQSEREYKEAKRARKQAKREFEESVNTFKRIGLSDVGAQAAARGRFRG